MRFERLTILMVTAAAVTTPVAARAQTQAAPAAPAQSADTPSIKIGVTLFADYTIVQEPKIADADGNGVSFNSFNIGRSYLNVTGNVSRRVAFRITPDIARESGTGSSLGGSYTFRLKYAYAQFNLDGWMPQGSWLRLGVQQTPWVEFMETLYRYRFQGTVFEDREGYLSSSDAGAAFHYNLPGNYGDVHGGVYNGESYTKAEVNDQKAFAVRGTFRPLPAHPILAGLRVTGFIDHDAYVRDAERRRGIVAVTFEHKYLNASFDYLAAGDRTSVTKPLVESHGLSMWATPRAPNGWEGLVRYDRLDPDTSAPGIRTRTIGGVAYWFPHQGNVSSAVLVDVEHVGNMDFTPARPDERRVAVHALVNF